MITVCIIEDIIEIQNGLKAVVASDNRFKLLESFDNAETAIEKLPILKPDVVIADINLPKKSGIDCVIEIKAKVPEILFVMFTIHEDNDQVFEALKAGASGYILKNTKPEKIIEALLEMNDGGSPMSPKIARKVITSFSKNQIENNTNDLISKREFEVVQLLSKGFLYKEIADELNVSISTIKKHLNNVYTKLQVQNRTEAINKIFGR